MSSPAGRNGEPALRQVTGTVGLAARWTPRRGVLGSGAASSRVVIPSCCLVLDLALVVTAILVASWLRQRLPVFVDAADVGDVVAQVVVPMVLGWLLLLWLSGTYRYQQLSAGTELYKTVVNASVVAAGLLGIGCYLFKLPLSRGFFVLSFLIGVPLLVLGRFVLRRGLHRAREHGLFRHRVLVAGDDVHVDEIATIMTREGWMGYRVVGALHGEGATHDHDTTPGGVRYVGQATTATDAVRRLGADAVVVAGGAFASSAQLRRAQWTMADHHVQLIVAPTVTDVAGDRVTVRPVAGLPLVHLEPPRALQARRFAKRSFDLVGAGLALVLVSPLILVSAVLVRADGGPVLFRQQRVGRDGRPFAMLKLRSMVVGAEHMLPALREDNESDGALFKIADDPRITRHGRWLRRFSVDELPQLLNVLRGEMSLVGPRPALATETSQYDDDYARRLRVRPGITGLWQVSGRSDLSWEDTVRLDLYYVDNWSILQDLTILTRTVGAVLRSDGAY